MTADELKAWRRTNGCSQSLLAQALGITTQTVSRWERETREISSFLHLALRCLELEGGDLNRKPGQYSIGGSRIEIIRAKRASYRAKRKKKERKVRSNGNDL
jgi:transcriptional regulator with XRE-family HTH domain